MIDFHVFGEVLAVGVGGLVSYDLMLRLAPAWRRRRIRRSPKVVQTVFEVQVLADRPITREQLASTIWKDFPWFTVDLKGCAPWKRPPLAVQVATPPDAPVEGAS